MRTKKVKSLIDVQRLIESQRDTLRKKFGVKRIGVFGSYSRNEQRDDSDIDIIVEFERPVGMIAFIRLQEYLEELLGVKVDLVTKGGLKGRIRERILREVKYI